MIATSAPADPLHASIAAAPLILFTIDGDGVFTLCAGAGLLTTSLSTEDLLGRSVFTVLANSPSALIACQRALTGELADGRATLGGREFHLRLTPARNSQGQVIGAHGVAFEVTTEHREEDALRESEARYRAIARTIPNLAIFLVDRELRFLLAEGGALTAQGYRREAIEGRPLADVLPAANAAELRPHFLAALAGEEHDFALARGDRAYEVSSRPIRDEQGVVVGALVVSQDVTARHQAEATLTEREARHRTILDALHEGIVLQDAAGRIIEANLAAERLLGLKADQMRGRTSRDPLWHAVHEDGTPCPGEEHPTAIALQTGRSQRNIVMGVRRQDSELVWFLVTAEPLIPPGATRPHGVVASFVDITGRKRAEEALHASEARYRALVDNNSDAVLLTAPDGRVLSANPAACRLFGGTEAEICAVGRAGLVDETDPRLPLLLAERARTGRLSSEITSRRLDGTTFPSEITSVIFQDVAGKSRTSMMIRDISARKQAEAEQARLLREMEALAARFQGLLESAPDAIVIADQGGLIALVNRQTEQLFGYDREELRGQPIEALLPERYRARHGEHRAAYVARPRTRAMGAELELFGRRKDGSEFPVEISLSPLHTPDDLLVTAVVRDISARKRAEAALRQSEEQFRSAFVHAAIGMALLGLDGRWLRVNRALCAITGHTEDALLSTNFQALTHPDDLASDLQHVEALLEGTIDSYQMEKRYRHRDGRFIWALLSMSLVRDENGTPVQLIAQIQDIDGRKQAEEALRASEARLAYQAAHDPLTDLPNRRRLGEALGAALARLRRQGTPMALLYLDLDDFKGINDQLGHEAGDCLLTEMADRLRACIREGDTPARLGGDEFALLLENAGASEAEVVARRLVAALSLPVQIGTTTVASSASIGAALASPGETADDLLRRADIALYTAKRAGKGQYFLKSDHAQ